MRSRTVSSDTSSQIARSSAVRNFVNIDIKLSAWGNVRGNPSNGNPEVPRNHFRLSSFAGTGRAEKNKPPFHLSPIKKDRDPGDHEHRNTHIQPHQRAAGRRLAARVGSAIKRAAPDFALA